MSNESGTPRTDAELCMVDTELGPAEVVRIECARQLERELTAKTAELEQFRKDANKWFLLLSDVVFTIPASFDGEDATTHAKCLNVAFAEIRKQAAINAAIKP